MAEVTRIGRLTAHVATLTSRHVVAAISAPVEGEIGPVLFTPEEARAFAGLLVTAADDAEDKARG